jgi:hypothetical protein
MEPYRSLFPSAGILLPVTEKYVLRLLTLPTGTGVSADDIHEICELIKFALTQPDAITAALTQPTQSPLPVAAT